MSTSIHLFELSLAVRSPCPFQPARLVHLPLSMSQVIVRVHCSSSPFRQRSAVKRVASFGGHTASSGLIAARCSCTEGGERSVLHALHSIRTVDRGLTGWIAGAGEYFHSNAAHLTTPYMPAIVRERVDRRVRVLHQPPACGQRSSLNRRAYRLVLRSATAPRLEAMPMQDVPAHLKEESDLRCLHSSLRRTDCSEDRDLTRCAASAVLHRPLRTAFVSAQRSTIERVASFGDRTAS